MIRKIINVSGLVWAIVGISFIFIYALVRITPHAAEAINSNLTALEWGALIAWSIFMLVVEGHRGFHKQFSPRVAARAKRLLGNPEPVDIIFAPLFCMGYFHTTKKRIVTTWSITFLIYLLVVIVSQFAQPYRGIIDAGVVVGLTYGLVSIYYFFFQVIVKKNQITNRKTV